MRWAGLREKGKRMPRSFVPGTKQKRIRLAMLTETKRNEYDWRRVGRNEAKTNTIGGGAPGTKRKRIWLAGLEWNEAKTNAVGGTDEA